MSFLNAKFREFGLRKWGVSAKKRPAAKKWCKEMLKKTLKLEHLKKGSLTRMKWFISIEYELVDSLHQDSQWPRLAIAGREGKAPDEEESGFRNQTCWYQVWNTLSNEHDRHEKLQNLHWFLVWSHPLACKEPVSYSLRQLKLSFLSHIAQFLSFV